MESPGTLPAHACKIKKKNHSEKFFLFSPKTFFLYFRKCNFIAPRLKNLVKNFLALRLTTFLYFRKLNFLTPRLKDFHKGTFRARKTKKNNFVKLPYILENGTFYHKVKKVLIFQEGILKA